jgi:hypothetical protein
MHRAAAVLDRPAQLLCTALLLYNGMAGAAPAPAGLPTPGLYRIDSEVVTANHNAGMPATSTTTRTSGASGNSISTSTIQGQASTTRKATGAHASTYCMQAGEQIVLPGQGECTASPATATKEGLIVNTHCAFMDTTTTVRKIDDKTWQMTSHSAQHHALDSTDGMAGMRRAIEKTAKYGRTPQEREKAQAALAQMPSEKSTQGMNIDSVQRWTRIADQCQRDDD